MLAACTWQSTRYSIVFIICSSDNIARLSFSTRDARKLGWKAICIYHKITVLISSLHLSLNSGNFSREHMKYIVSAATQWSGIWFIPHLMHPEQPEVNLHQSPTETINSVLVLQTRWIDGNIKQCNLSSCASTPNK